MFEVRFHGRGGQGGQMAAQALADAAFVEGYYAVAFPFFGAERRGAPVAAFARVDKKKIRARTEVYEPDYVVVLDDSLIETVNVTQGLKNCGIVVINTTKKPEEIDLGVKMKVATVDATDIALEYGLGTKYAPVVNGVILGAFAKATGALKLESIQKGIMDIFGGRLGENVGKKNSEAAKVAFERTTTPEFCKFSKKIEVKKMWMPTVQELPLGCAAFPMKTDAGLVGPGSFVENKTGSWATFQPKIDKTKCINCEFCWFYCPEGCISRSPEGLKVDKEYCKGCGICANECPKKAIEMVRV